MWHIIGIEPQFENIISNGPYIPMAAGKRKPETQWTPRERKAANLDQGYKKQLRVNDLEEEYQARALLAKSKRFFKKGTQRFSNAKETDQTECHKCGKKGHFAIDCWSKTSVPSYQSPFQPNLLHSPEHKPEPRHTKDFEAKYNKVKAKLTLLKEVSSDDNEVIEVKALMTLADEERVSIGKDSTRNGEWIKISMKKHVNIEILKENLRKKLKKLTSITEAWLTSSNKVNQCISEQIPTQKKKILEIDQLTKDTSSSGPKDLVFIKSSADKSEVSITGSNKPKLSEAEDSTLSNHDTGKVPLNELQRNTTDHSVVVSDSLATDYDSADESSVSPARGNKSSSASKTNSALAGKLKNVKIEDDPPLAIIIKELNELKLQRISHLTSETRTLNSYDHDTHGHNMIISLRKGIKPGNPQYVTKNCETCGSNVHTTFDHNNIEWFRKREALQAKKDVPGPEAMFSAKAEDIATAGCCAIILWIKSQLTDYDIIYEKVPITIQFRTKKTKLIDVRSRIILSKGTLNFISFPLKYQLADIFIKLLDKPCFKKID
ncbi:putative reverse transcriptase domain, ribonuclease H-like domain, aspartic peptidase domain protein [Tanacetum coccineum]